MNNDDAPNTMTIVMNYWWQEDKKIALNAVAEVPPIKVEPTHNIVIQIRTIHVHWPTYRA